jgi:hypothetical protein
MKYEAIKELLDRYWEGETSLEEERSIKAYFNAGQVDERLKSLSPMFQAIREEKAVQLKAKAKSAPIRPQMYLWAMAASLALVLTAAWWMFREDNVSASLAVETPKEQPKINEKPMAEAAPSNLIPERKIAAKANSPKHKNLLRKPKTNPAIDAETAQAMAEIKAALALVSSKLDKGKNKAIQCATHMEVMEKVPKRKEG